MKTANISVRQSIDENLKQFTYEIGSEWEQSSRDAVDSFVEHTISKSVLELGCGDGAGTNRLLELGYKVTAVDINQDKLNKIVNATQVKSDILDYLKTLPDKSVENIFTHHALEHCVHATEIINEISRVLNGVVMIVVPDDGVHETHHTSFESPEEIRVPGTKPILNNKINRHLPEYWYIGVSDET